MTRDQIDAAIADRFGRWAKFLRQQGATPMIVIGLRARDQTITLATVEEMPDGLIADALVTAARLIVEGKADQA